MGVPHQHCPYGGTFEGSETLDNTGNSAKVRKKA
jgi:hypothetical protein